MSGLSPVDFRSPIAYPCAVVSATATAYVKRSNAYLIDILRTPLDPLSLYATWRIAYAVAGHGRVAPALSGFLLVGMVGLITWTSTIWSSGYAIEQERWEGTVTALFLAPASRTAVVVGYGLGSLIWLLPSFAVVMLIGVATGARLHVADPFAAVVALAALPPRHWRPGTRSPACSCSRGAAICSPTFYSCRSICWPASWCRAPASPAPCMPSLMRSRPVTPSMRFAPAL